MNSSEYSEIKRRVSQFLGQFGEIYLPEDIKIQKSDLLGLDVQKEYLNSFFKALSDFSVEYKNLKTRNNDQSFFPIPIIFSALLVGKPGTGKTTLAKAFAKEYGLPIVVVFSNALIGSLLGESLNRVKNLLRQAEMYAREGNPLILFFDEIDAISSERANKSDVGEIKRMVISFLQELDLILEKQLPLGVIGATNHPDQLDRAVWRRFTFKIEFPAPDDNMRLRLIHHFLEKVTERYEVDFKLEGDYLTSLLYNSAEMTGADIERAFQIAVLQSYANRKDQNASIVFNFPVLLNAVKSLAKRENEEKKENHEEEEENHENNDSSANPWEPMG